MTSESDVGTWLGDLSGGVVREYAEDDDKAVLELHGDEDMAAMTIDRETAVWLADASEELRATIDGGDA